MIQKVHIQTDTHQSYERGQALLVTVVILVAVAVGLTFAVATPVIREVKQGERLLNSKQSIILAESGVEDIAYRLNHSMNTSLTENLVLGTYTAVTTVTNIPPDRKEISAEGNVAGHIRRTETVLVIGAGAAFNFGIQSGDGGIHMFNSSSVEGNAYSNGPIIGAGNTIGGDVISAGASGLIDNIYATSSAYAHTIQNSTVDRDAYCQEGTGNTVNGDSSGCPNAATPDQPPSILPITDPQIDEWKADAEAGGVITSPCPYVINAPATLGPVKIICDLEIRQSSADVTLAGNVWVEGSILTAVGQPTIRIDPSLGANSVVVIADNGADRITSSKIELQNSAEFVDSGTEGSYILLISQNNSAEMGGSEVAIDITQSAEGDFLVYAGHGEVQLQQSSDLREVTGYKITLRNTAKVTYESGLASLLFTGGPGGGFEILSWREVP